MCLWVSVAGKHDVLLKMFPEDDASNPAIVRGDQDQLDWFNSTLCASTADWNLIIGHFPIYSATTGEHGNTDTLVRCRPVFRPAWALHALHTCGSRERAGGWVPSEGMNASHARHATHHTHAREVNTRTRDR